MTTNNGGYGAATTAPPSLKPVALRRCTVRSRVRSAFFAILISRVARLPRRRRRRCTREMTVISCHRGRDICLILCILCVKYKRLSLTRLARVPYKWRGTLDPRSREIVIYPSRRRAPFAMTSARIIFDRSAS